MSLESFGIIDREPADVYHASAAVGSHKLATIDPYPLLYYRRYIAKTAPLEPSTPAMDFGAYFHCLTLEGEDEANRRFVVAPDVDRRTKDGKAEWAKFIAQAGTKTIITDDDVTLAWRMVGAVREKPSAVALLAEGEPEVTFRHQMQSFAVQCRVDWWRPGSIEEPMIVDVKTVEELAAFDRQFFSLGYYKQAAFYRLVVAAVLGIETFRPQFCYLVVEKNEPFQAAIRVPDAESLAIGTQEVMADLQRLKTCYETNTWPGEPDEARPITLPEFKMRQAAEKVA